MVYGVLEELPTGIWILSPAGTTVSINRYAHRICRLLLKSQAKQEAGSEAGEAGSEAGSLEQSLLMPQAVWRLHQAVLESRDLFPQRPMIIEDRVQLGSLTVDLRARWLELELDSYVLVMLESPQIHPLAKLAKVIHRGAGRQFGQQAGPDQSLYSIIQ